MNKFHRLIRKRKSVTFMDKTDEQILQQVAQDAGLTLDVEARHERSRTSTSTSTTRRTWSSSACAPRGWAVTCGASSTTLNVKQPDLAAATPGIDARDRRADRRAADSFAGSTPRVSSAPIANKMTVKGWNPETKQLITGDGDRAGLAARLAERERSLGRHGRRGELHRRPSDLEHRGSQRRSRRPSCRTRRSRT